MERPDHSRAMNFLGAIALSLEDKMARRIEQQTGLSHGLAAALIQIAMNPDQSLAHLRRMTGLSQPNTSRLVDHLVREGLVTRERGLADDQRFALLNVTEAGQKVCDLGLGARYEVLGDVLGHLSLAERDLLETLLEKMMPYVASTEADSHVICRLCDYMGCPQDRCPADHCFREEPSRNAA